jgi:hypothetical protein
MYDTCPICLEDNVATQCILGCDHAFCVPCAARWCTTQRAFCPMCQQKVYGILTPKKDILYLSPHLHKRLPDLESTPSGLRVKASVDDDLSILPSRAIVTIDQIRDIEEAKAHMSEQWSRHRMVCIRVVGMTRVEPSRCCSCLFQ